MIINYYLNTVINKKNKHLLIIKTNPFQSAVTTLVVSNCRFKHTHFIGTENKHIQLLFFCANSLGNIKWD